SPEKASNQNHVSKLKIWLMIVCYAGSSSMVKTQFQLFQIQSFASVQAVFCSLALTELGNRAFVLGCNSAR
ncbi:TPA: hypothetical protein ACQYBJ_004525, partial [Vibrio parahaemolyticus]|uniref:hypothetical protein n=1 Tax=Vibrio sp. zbq_2 TaxID=3367238 RepID=UPI00370BADF5